MTSALFSSLQSNYHPEFNDLSGDLVIEADGGVRFRTHQLLLKLASPVFSGILTRQDSTDNVLHLREDPNVLVDLLRIISMKPLPPVETYEEMERLLKLAEKYQMAGPISTIRAGMSLIPHDDADVLRVYRLACQSGWGREAQIASSKTLSLDLGDIKHAPSLALLDTPSLLALLQLHRARRDGIAEVLADESRFSSIFAFRCRQHPSGISHEDKSEVWATVSAQIVQLFSRRPDGEIIKNLTPKNVPFSKTLRSIRCSHPTCSTHSCTKFIQELLRTIVAAINELPTVISLDGLRKNADVPSGDRTSSVVGMEFMPATQQPATFHIPSSPIFNVTAINSLHSSPRSVICLPPSVVDPPSPSPTRSSLFSYDDAELIEEPEQPAATPSQTLAEEIGANYLMPAFESKRRSSPEPEIEAPSAQNMVDSILEDAPPVLQAVPGLKGKALKDWRKNMNRQMKHLAELQQEAAAKAPKTA